jgi:hypothetical protein
MHATITQAWPNEAPTKPAVAIPSRTFAAVIRIDRLAKLAAERLSAAPSEEVIALALDDLAELRELAAEVLR